MDHDDQSLIFPDVGLKFIRVSLKEAADVATRAGINSRLNALTRRFWQLRLLECRPGLIIQRGYFAKPMERRAGAGIAIPLQVMPN